MQRLHKTLIIVIIIDAIVPNINLLPLSSQPPFIACYVIKEDRVNISSLPVHAMFSSSSRGRWRDTPGRRVLHSGMLLLAPIILLPASILGTFTGAYSQLVLVAPLWTISLWFSVVSLWSDSQWVPWVFQEPTCQPGRHKVGFHLAIMAIGPYPSISAYLYLEGVFLVGRFYLHSLLTSFSLVSVDQLWATQWTSLPSSGE